MVLKWQCSWKILFSEITDLMYIFYVMGITSNQIMELCPIIWPMLLKTHDEVISVIFILSQNVIFSYDIYVCFMT